MSGDAQPAEIDGEYRREEKRKEKNLDSKHTVPKITTQLLAKDYDVNLSTGYFKSDGVDRQQLPTDLHKCVGESQLATVKRSKLDDLDAYDTASAAFVGKFMVVNYFTCLDDIANAIDDLFTLEDLYVSATGDSDKSTVEPVAFEPSDDGIYDNYKRQVNSFGETRGYKCDSGQLVPNLSMRPRLTGAKAVLTGLLSPKSKRHSSKWLWSLLPSTLMQNAEVVRDSAHPQLPPSWQLSSSNERLRALACSFFRGKKELRDCFASSSVSQPSCSVSSSAKMCFQEPFVAREHEMCLPLVPRNGNQEYDTAGARLVLLHQVAGLVGLVETTAHFCLQESGSLHRARSQGGVQKGSVRCAETFGAEVC
jgi:hypothetical protein